MEVEESFGSS